MSIIEFAADEIVSRANVNSRITQANAYFPVSIENGGTGGVTESAARYNLGLRKGYIIYDNPTGVQGTVNFDTGYTADEFAYIQIFYFCKADTSLWLRSSVTSYFSTGTNVNMTTMYYDGTNYKCFTRSVTINSTSLTLAANTRGTMRYTTSSSGGTSTGDETFITRVIGYKY